uniref:UDP-glucuronosyltransferase n=1 Tax=Fopius arisanus TaxID=64838 RepID=A0A0C9RNU1_9HYME
MKLEFCLVLLHILLLSPLPSTSESPGKRLRILGAFAHPGKSHFAVFKPLLEELANRGHDVTVISYFPRSNSSPPLPNYKDIDLAGEDNIFVEVVDLQTLDYSLLREFMLLRHWGLECCQRSLDNKDVQRLIKSNAKFDLIITEVFNSDCFLGFVHRFKAPFIGLSSHVLMPWANGRLSNERNPSYVPILFLGYGPKMGFMERVENYLAHKIFNFAYGVFCNGPTQKLVEEAFGPNVPALDDIAKNISAILVNSHYSLHGAAPNLPNIVEVGGLHIPEKHQPLPADIQKFLDDASEGVVFFSWGSMIKASSMDQRTLGEVLQALGSIPWKVLWKWEDEHLPGKPDNVMVKKWVPQAAILRHPNVKCYLAHGGLLGLSEGVSAGVPMVVVPMYGDQFNNAAAARSRGVAQVLEWNNLNGKTLKAAIDRVFNDPTYMENAKALQKVWHDRPMSPVETSVWWAEYVGRGQSNQFLRTAAADLAWYQLEHLDVIGFLLLILLVVIFAFYKALIVIFRKIFPPEKRVNGNSLSKKRN